MRGLTRPAFEYRLTIVLNEGFFKNLLQSHLTDISVAENLHAYILNILCTEEFYRSVGFEVNRQSILHLEFHVNL